VCFEQAHQVLVRALGRRRQQNPAVAEFELAPQVGFRARLGGVFEPEPVEGHVDAVRRDAQQFDDVVTRRPRHGNDPVGPPRGRFDQQAQTECPQSEVRLRVVPVDQVVDGRDALERAVQRRGAGQGVHDVGAREPGRARHVLLLATDPLDAAARVHRDLHRRDQIAPRPAARRGGLLVDEGGQFEPGALFEERRDQLAGDRLHAADLAGDEEDQVERDVHAAASVGAATSPQLSRNALARGCTPCDDFSCSPYYCC
jgi:hypothetical protein